MDGFVPSAAVFFVEATAELLAAIIPEHTLTPYFVVIIVEEWATNHAEGNDFFYNLCVVGEARDATAPRLWSSMVGMMTELGMEWSTVVHRGINKLQVGVKGQHIADVMESGIVAMAQHPWLLIKRTGAPTPLGDEDADDPMTDNSTSSAGGMDMIYLAELEPWLLEAHVRDVLLESPVLEPMELGSISCMRSNFGDRGTAMWRVSIMASHPSAA